MIRAMLVLMVLMPGVFAQSPPEKATTVAFIRSLQDPATGGFAVEAAAPGQKLQPSLRACNGAVKTLKMLGAEVPELAKVRAFVQSCQDPATGHFAEPAGKPDVTITAIGIMVARELDVPRGTLVPSIQYLADHAKTFDEVRISGAAIEAFGIAESKLDLTPWTEIVQKRRQELDLAKTVAIARELGGATAFLQRLNLPVKNPTIETTVEALKQSVNAEHGGWCLPGQTGFDIDTTYRIMRCLHLCKIPHPAPDTLRKTLSGCRNADGGYGVKPGAPSSMSGVYYCTILAAWLN
ncbi:MAG: prenyltransferase/squalene oxidase repeat-containing protein [Gemmataceae bacterium]